MVKSGGGGRSNLDQSHQALWLGSMINVSGGNIKSNPGSLTISRTRTVPFHNAPPYVTQRSRRPFVSSPVFVQLSEVTMSVHFIVFPQVFPRHVTLYWDFATCQRWLLNFFLPQSISWPKSSYLDLAQETKWFVIKHVRFYNIKTGFELDKSKHLPQLWWWYIAA